MNDSFITNWKSQLKKGTLTFIILNILHENEFYGYELIEQLRKHAKMDIAEGTLYPLMNRLKTEELVSSKWVEQGTGIPRKYYSLTESGKNILREMNSYWNHLQTITQKIIK
ncbi:PadR family transcriptional regulator [Pedobacter frigidisoli]|uniref:PadR family transcriptional regulator n=1 Tax=Pedobacter frigidisoli TaxID=2530455 RepID=UPI002930B182|nr:PadR family transcriptional regulator [Pedobacter frigidisoli]